MWQKAEKFLANDKLIAPLIKKYGPCKIRPRDKRFYFEDLADSITGQQLSAKAAATIFERLKEKCGRKLTPEKILRLKTEEMRNCGLSYAKCSSVKDLAQHVKSKKLKVNLLDKIPDEEVIKELVAVRGIGRWTAEMFLMFTLARKDIFPIDDLGIRNGVKKLTAKELKPKQLFEFGKRFEPFRTVAAWYIWASLDNKK